MDPLELLDPRIASAARASGAARAELAAAVDPEDVPNPLGRSRSVSSRATYAELGDLPKSPLTEGARAWVAHLTLERVLWVDVVREEAARRAESVRIDLGGGGEVSTVEVTFRRLLADAEPVRRRHLGAALAKGADGVRAAARLAAERRREAARQLGLDLDRLEIPLDDPADLAMAAERVLASTEAVRPNPAPWSDALDPLLARDAAEGWPARATSRWLLAPFDGTSLFDGLRLAPARLPQILGASSFARAFAELGAAWFDASRPPSAPFTTASAPFDVHRARRAALLGGLVTEPAFHARVLGLGRSRARDQARIMRRALALRLRLDAALALLRGVLTLSPTSAAHAWEEQIERALGAPIPGSLAGVLPRRAPGLAARFLGAIAATRDRGLLIERFDEDWFRSPHAARALREEDSVVAPPRLDAVALSASLAALAAVDLG